MMKLTMFLFALLFVATAAKDVDPHGVEAFAAAKLGSSEVYKASVLPYEEKDLFESAFDGWSTFQLTHRGLSATNRRMLKGNDDGMGDDGDDDHRAGTCITLVTLVLDHPLPGKQLPRYIAWWAGG